MWVPRGITEKKTCPSGSMGSGEESCRERDTSTVGLGSSRENHSGLYSISHVYQFGGSHIISQKVANKLSPLS